MSVTFRNTETKTVEHIRVAYPDVLAELESWKRSSARDGEVFSHSEVDFVCACRCVPTADRPALAKALGVRYPG